LQLEKQIPPLCCGMTNKGGMWQAGMGWVPELVCAARGS
jgi:hypothetical protein